eukprot:Amastigsp_a345854_70.p3 type:complete len:178 gc:universal Amastigsp_a345854_70:559-26(-)
MALRWCATTTSRRTPRGCSSPAPRSPSTTRRRTFGLLSTAACSMSRHTSSSMRAATRSCATPAATTRAASTSRTTLAKRTTCSRTTSLASVWTLCIARRKPSPRPSCRRTRATSRCGSPSTGTCSTSRPLQRATLAASRPFSATRAATARASSMARSTIARPLRNCPACTSVCSRPR